MARDVRVPYGSSWRWRLAAVVALVVGVLLDVYVVSGFLGTMALWVPSLVVGGAYWWQQFRVRVRRRVPGWYPRWDERGDTLQWWDGASWTPDRVRRDPEALRRGSAENVGGVDA